jgi:hypothetical protein
MHTHNPSPLCLELCDGEGKADEGEGHGAHSQRSRACGYVPDPDPGCLSWISDPIFSIPDPHQRIEVF